MIIAPDKFKGSLNSFEVCNAIAAGIKQVYPSAEIGEFPMADGGDGFSVVLQYYLHTETVTCKTVDPLGSAIEASYQWDKHTQTAIIEAASASGLVLLKKSEQNPLYTSTYGTGILILDAIQRGVKKIILGLGGTATNDAGSGILAALGFSFEDALGKTLQANGENLLQVKKIIPPLTNLFNNVHIEIACDVQNTLHGPDGAAYIYARQKGANDKAIQFLDNGLKNYTQLLQVSTGKDIANIPGTGAAGGIAASLLCYADTIITRGIDIVINASNILHCIDNTDWIITGEGKIDGQTLEGKVISAIAELAFTKQIPTIAFCGLLDATPQEIATLKLNDVVGLVSEYISKIDAMKNAASLLSTKATNYFKALK